MHTNLLLSLLGQKKQEKTTDGAVFKRLNQQHHLVVNQTPRTKPNLQKKKKQASSCYSFVEGRKHSKSTVAIKAPIGYSK